MYIHLCEDSVETKHVGNVWTCTELHVHLGGSGIGLRDQLMGESAEQYITCLYSLIETCEYGAFKEEMLRD